MNCSRFEDVLSEYLDGSIARDEAAHFRVHALECRICRRLLDEVKTTVQDCHTHEDEVDAPLELESLLLRIVIEQRPIDCFAFQEIITEFLDGFVPAQVYHRFEEHATSCESCSNLLTEVVYAVAACHSVHTYEEYAVPESLTAKLEGVMPVARHSLRRILSNAAVAACTRLLPRMPQSAGWSVATASLLLITALSALLFGFSEDRTVKGIFRQARVTAVEIYSQGSDLYAQKHEVMAQIEQVKSNLDEIWHTIGGKATTNKPAAPNPPADASSKPPAPSKSRATKP